MTGSQKYHVETCIKTLSDVGESRILGKNCYFKTNFSNVSNLIQSSCHTPDRKTCVICPDLQYSRHFKVVGAENNKFCKRSLILLFLFPFFNCRLFLVFSALVNSQFEFLFDWKSFYLQMEVPRCKFFFSFHLQLGIVGLQSQQTLRARSKRCLLGPSWWWNTLDIGSVTGRSEGTPWWTSPGTIEASLRGYRWGPFRHVMRWSLKVTLLIRVSWFESQDIVSLLEDQLRPLVQSELSVLGDVLYRPELMFPRQSEAWHKSKSGGFVSRYNWTEFELFQKIPFYKRFALWRTSVLCSDPLSLLYLKRSRCPFIIRYNVLTLW